MSKANEEFADDHRVNEFCKLFGQVQRPLHRYIYAMILNDADAYDVLQETNLAMWQQFDSFQPKTNFKAWAKEIARYRILKYHRLNKRRSMPLDLDSLQQIAERLCNASGEDVGVRDAALHACLQELNESDRSLVHARYTTDNTLAETAQVLKRSTNSLSQSLRRIRSQLRNCINRKLALT